MMDDEREPYPLPEPDECRPGLVPRLFVDDDDAVDGDELTIRGPKARRLHRVLRLRRDDPLEVVHPPGGEVCSLRVERSTRDFVSGRIVERRPISAQPPPPVVLCPAVIRPQRFDFAVEKATEIGVAAIQPVRSERSQLRSDGPQRQGRWRRIATEAAEQCRRDVRPEVLDSLDAREVMTGPPVPGGVRLLASALETDQRISSVIAECGLPSEVRVLVGPEGGFTRGEAALAREHGWRPVTLADRPLRAETASIVAVALVEEALAPLRLAAR